MQNNTCTLSKADEVQAATRDSDYWSDYGNLILVSQGVAFRIPKSPLAEHSAMFQRMLAQVTPTAEDLVDGCTAVVLDDFPKDWRELFGLIYPLSTNVELGRRKVEMALISAIIRLGYKYDMKELYDQAMGYLTAYYTTSFDAWADGRHAARWQPDPIHAITAINLARLTNTVAILPAAFYICATLSPDLERGGPLEDGSREMLSLEDRLLVSEMKGRMISQNARTAHLLFQPPSARVFSTKGCCSEVWDKLLRHAGLPNAPHPLDSQRALDSWVVTAASFASTTTVGLMGSFFDLQHMLCNACRNRLQARDRELRRAVWRRLPEFLGLTIEGWDA